MNPLRDLTPRMISRPSVGVTSGRSSPDPAGRRSPTLAGGRRRGSWRRDGDSPDGEARRSAVLATLRDNIPGLARSGVGHGAAPGVLPVSIRHFGLAFIASLVPL